MFKEEKIATYTSKGRRIQLLKITKVLERPSFSKKQYYIAGIKYQIKVNRRINSTHMYESQAAKKMANIIASELLQQKICF